MSSLAADTFAVRVARKRAEAHGIASFELVHPEGEALPPFSAGAHVDVHLPGGTIVRPYSICSAPHERSRYVLCVLREPQSRGGSSALHDAVAEGDVLRIGRPRNLFALADGAPHYLLLAGGIGITPILSMAQQLGQAGASFALHYAVQHRDRAALLGPLAAPGLAERTWLYCGSGDGAARMDIAGLLAAAAPGTHVYACGPARMLQAVQSAAAAQGWARERVHVELFAAPQVLRADGDAAFDLVLARSGRVVPVPAGCSATEALAAAGVAVPTSCGQGVCGTCLVGVVSGVPDHRDMYLSPEEQQRNDQFLPCCSRALTGQLVVDL